MIAEDIVKTARTQLGVKFQHQGRLPGTALDCIGLVIHVCNVLEIPYEDRSNYKRHAEGDTLPNELKKWLDVVPNIEEPKLGDMHLFKMSPKDFHIGIVTDYEGKGLIHTYAQAKKVCEVFYNDYWHKKLAECYRVRGVKWLH